MYQISTITGATVSTQILIKVDKQLIKTIIAATKYYFVLNRILFLLNKFFVINQ